MATVIVDKCSKKPVRNIRRMRVTLYIETGYNSTWCARDDEGHVEDLPQAIHRMLLTNGVSGLPYKHAKVEVLKAEVLNATEAKC